MPRRLKTALSWVLYSWINPTIRRGLMRPLEAEDMPPLPDRLHPANTPPGFALIPVDGPWKFLFGLLSVVKKEVWLMAGLILLHGLCALAAPLFLREVITTVEKIAAGGELGPAEILKAVALCAAAVGEALFFQHYIYWALTGNQVITNGMNLRIFAKSLTLSRAARQRTPTGEAVNYLGADTDTVAEFIWVVVESVYCMLMVLAVTAALIWLLGPSALLAVAAMVIASPVARRLAGRFASIDDAIMSHRDRRVARISQILSGIRVVKFFAWQSRMLEEIREIRGLEVEARRRLALARSHSMLFTIALATLVSAGTFLIYALSGRNLDAATVFPAVALIGLLDYPIHQLTHYLAESAAAKVSAQRLCGFFREESWQGVDQTPRTVQSRPAGLTLTGVEARFGGTESSVLKGISLSIAPGEAVAIVGAVGAGKTSLLLTVLGEIPLVTGTVGFTGLGVGEVPATAFVPQEAFIRNGSLRDNLTFGVEVPDGAIKEAVRAAALEHDIAGFAAGLATEIGEHGINLSGGQKQRLALARALLARPGLYLLDDPLSAVDGATEEHLVDDMVFGAMAGATRLVVTHRVDHLRRFDRIILLDDGRVRAIGTFDELVAGEPAFQAYVRSEALDRTPGERSGPSVASPGAGVVNGDAATGRITEDEDRERGAVRPRVYLDYLLALGGGQPGWSRRLSLGMLIAAAVAAMAAPIIQTVWLAVWTGQPQGAGTLPSGLPLAEWLSPLRQDQVGNALIFGAIGLIAVALQYWQNRLWSVRAVDAGRSLHDDALKATLAAKVRFFDATPMGRILNRFSRDVDGVERQLAWSFETMVRAVVSVAGSTVIILSVAPLLVVAVAPVFGAFLRLQSRYRASSREAQRLSSVARSPRFAHFKETLVGLPVIRAYRREPIFMARFHETLAHHQRMYYGMIVMNRWFSVRVPLICAVITLAVAASVIWLAKSGGIVAGTAGLVMFYGHRFWESLNWSVRTFAETEARMTSVERLRRYAALPAEPDVERGPALAPGQPWPAGGKVEFQAVAARYGDDLPEVLRQISFSVPAGTRVGITGRTGSGKSTLFQLLYRLISPSEGAVLIDDVDIRRVPLARLRRAIAMIPQDPTLFNGTLRENLDRFAEKSDEEVWQALERVRLGLFVRNLPGGLNAEVCENGHNFSQGQRQLFCLARALLIGASVIVMDEATASVDLETDALVQSTIRREFAGRTVLIIAHRLETVADCDLLIELDSGRLARPPRCQPATTAASVGLKWSKAVPSDEITAEPAPVLSGLAPGSVTLQ